MRMQTAALVVAAGLVMTATACKLPKPPVTAGCAWMTEDRTVPNEGRTVILIDVSNSTRSASPRLGPDYAQGLEPLVAGAVDKSDAVRVGSFSGRSADVAWLPVHHTTPTFSEDQNRKSQLAKAKGCLGKLVETATREAPRQPGTDVLEALRAASAWLRQAAGPRTLVAATDGLPNVGCANLTTANLAPASLAQDSAATTIVNACLSPTSKELVPGEMAQVQMHFIGIGRPAGEMPQPNAAQRDWLDRLWSAICAAAGAESCHVSTDSIGDGTGAPPPPVVGLADVSVSFRGPGRAFSLPAAVFETDSVEVRPDFIPVIDRLAIDIRAVGATRVVVEGHTDSRASDDYNLDLSRRRASAVARLLLERSVPNVTWIGLGETQRICTDEFPNGVPDEQCLQQNRRVDVVVTAAEH